MAIYEKSPLSPFLIIGLGNPGREYKHNRHNIGFMLVDRLAERLGITFSRLESRALITKGDYRGQRLVLAKPQTYMNLSGQSAGALVRFYKVSLEHFLVAYDDVDLPFGMLRLRPSGGSAGQKGVISIIERLGSQEFPRLRLGIEAEILPQILDRAVEAVLTFVSEGLVTAMNSYNTPLDIDQ